MIPFIWNSGKGKLKEHRTDLHLLGDIGVLTGYL